MVPFIKAKIPELLLLCQQYKLSKLWIFGSAVDEDRFNEQSDLDFLYEFDVQKEYDPNFPYATNWSDMLNQLRELFGRDIQLIPNGEFRNPYFKEAVEQSKVLIYDKDGEKVAV